MSTTAGMMPELGSKISLISKADIRYEGRLFTVDPQECTIALANVRSFGTEDRETPYPIAPQPTVYDYILFRGSDIKDIRVVNNVAIPNDPAIMQMHLPPNQIPPPQQQGFPPQNFPPMQQPGAQFGPFAQMQGPPANNMSGPAIPQQPPQAQLTSPNQPQQQQHPQQQQQQQQQTQSNQQGNAINNLTPTTTTGHVKKSNSRSGTPNARKSPTSEMGVQTNQTPRDHMGGNRDRNQKNQRNNNNRERRDSGRNEMQQDNKGGYRQNQRMPQQRGGYVRNNQIRNNQGGSGRMRAPQNYYRQNKPQNGQQRGNKPNTLKFDNEFDFEQANSKFEELRSQLSKLKVGSEENKNTEQVNGEIEKKDDSGNETGADHEVEGEDIVCYDKTKSFFDNISCEASERSKGKSSRPDWRQERKINSETFGLSMNRRGNMRGRGYYNRTQYNNRPGNYRSGIPPQYRNNRNRNIQNNSGRPNNNQGQVSQNQQPVAAN